MSNSQSIRMHPREMHGLRRRYWDVIDRLLTDNGPQNFTVLVECLRGCGLDYKRAASYLHAEGDKGWLVIRRAGKTRTVSHGPSILGQCDTFGRSNG